MEFRKRLATFGAAMAATLTMTGVAPAGFAEPRADEVVAANVCDGHAMSYIAKYYYRGPSAIPLRCGSISWGYRHLVERGRWNFTFDAMIAEAVSRGTVKPTVGGRWHYIKLNNSCGGPPYFSVLDNPLAYGANPKINPQGIITAYYAAAAPSLAGAGLATAEC